MRIVKKISPLDLVERLKNEDIFLVDIRNAQEYADECLKSSINIPIEELKDNDFENIRNKVVVFYCRGGHRTAQATELLRKQPFKEIVILEGGLMAWKAQRLATKKSTRAPMDIMRQVQIIAGSLVMLGVVLGVTVSPNYLFISGFVGGGLFLAGISGFCGMARFLRFMPWNKRII
ncbi:rhodanese-like domain-containing protein [Kiloniella sp.]|uniref:rhodanese-like domain-containing protein n=1 Tax=Kiloniella sp. TaxID=1938587 RepID=UPI003B018632